MTPPFNPPPRVLRWLAILLPVAFWVGILLLRSLVFANTFTWNGALFELVAIAVGASLFSFWVFRLIGEREQEIQRGSQQLTALHDAAITLTTETELHIVLQKVVDLARNLVQARYGALGVLQDDGNYIEQFITTGITPEQRAELGPLPRGHGLLGALIRDGKPLRIPDIAQDPNSVGFPPNHPPMRTLLGVPIRSKGRVMGDLYMTDKLGKDANVTVFTAQDQQTLEMFATQAAIAIENAQLYRQKQQLAILQERERIGMDLHDGIIQSIYAIGLQLEDAQARAEQEPQQAAPRIHQAILGLNDVIRDIRNYILDLSPQRFQGRNLARGLEELARDVRANTLLTVNLVTDTLEPDLLSPEQTVEILHVAQETLTNVRKHAHAGLVELDLIRDADAVILTIQDNGIGLAAPQATGSGGNGIPNMRERARAAGGQLTIEPAAEHGTRITLRIPLVRSPL